MQDVDLFLTTLGTSFVSENKSVEEFGNHWNPQMFLVFFSMALIDSKG